MTTIIAHTTREIYQEAEVFGFNVNMNVKVYNVRYNDGYGWCDACTILATDDSDAQATCNEWAKHNLKGYKFCLCGGITKSLISNWGELTDWRTMLANAQ